MRPTLHLPTPDLAPRVKEAQQTVVAAVGELDQSLVPFALRMTEARDAWSNGRKR